MAGRTARGNRGTQLRSPLHVVVGLVLVAALLLCTGPPSVAVPASVRVDRAECPSPFPDVTPDNPFCADIVWAVDRGIVTGFDDGNYRPGAPVSRQSMAAFLYRLSGSPAFTPPPTPSFPDVGPTHAFRTEIEWLASTGTTGGFPDGTFRPTSPVSRQSMAAFLFRLGGAPPHTPPSDFTLIDVPAGHPFRVPISWLVSVEVASGFPDGTYRPAMAVGRQAMAGFLQRFDGVPPVAGNTELISSTAHGVSAAGASLEPAISGNGAVVAFTSAASDLVTSDTNQVTDVFVHERQTDEVERMSMASSGTQGNGDSFRPDVSTGGRYVVFASDASNLVPNDTNARTDIFLHDRQTGTTTRVSRTLTNGQASADSDEPSLSDDARIVTYERSDRAFVWNRDTGATTMLPVPPIGDGASQQRIDAPIISGDGHSVVARYADDSGPSVCDQIEPICWNTWVERLLRWDLDDVTGGPDVVVNIADSWSGEDLLAWAVSSTGRHVAYQRDTRVVSWDGTTGDRTTIATGIHLTRGLAISDNGRFIAFHRADPGSEHEYGDEAFVLRLWDRDTGVTRTIPDERAIELAVGQGWSEPTPTVSISHSGAVLAWDTRAPGLTVGDDDVDHDVVAWRWGDPRAPAPGRSLPFGQVGVAYAASLVADGGRPPLTFTFPGGAPAGLDLDPTTGVISGVPTEPTSTTGTWIPVTVTDADERRATVQVAWASSDWAIDTLWQADPTTQRNSHSLATSADGSTVAVVSDDALAGAGIADGTATAYLRTAESSSWRPVAFGVNEGDGDGDQPVWVQDLALSGDGRWLVYSTDDGVFLWDDLMQTTTDVTQGQLEATWGHWHPDISDDGRFVVFASDGGWYESGRIHLWDRDTDTLTELPLTDGSSRLEKPAISGDGNRIAYVDLHFGSVGSVDGSSVRVWDRLTEEISVAPEAPTEFDHWFARPISISEDGGRVLFHREEIGVTRLWDLDAAEVTDVADHTEHASLSPDGTTIAFWSEHAGLVPGDRNGRLDLFVADLEGNTIDLVSVLADGEQVCGSAWTYDPNAAPSHVCATGPPGLASDGSITYTISGSILRFSRPSP